jgi:hypothetical protein
MGRKREFFFSKLIHASVSTIVIMMDWVVYVLLDKAEAAV